jgi:hypothetical protein
MTGKTIALVAGVALSLALLMLIIDETITCCSLAQLGGGRPSILILDRSDDASNLNLNLNLNSNSKLTKLLANQQQLLKLALKSKIQTKAKAKAKPVACKAPLPIKKASPKFKDWAAEGQVTQSSTYQSLQASNAIDGKMDTFSHTEIKPNQNSWLKLSLPTSVEINKIIIENRKDAPGSFQLRKRLPPFTVTIRNAAGMVTASKMFTDILQTYTWSDIFVVGSQITIEQQKKNYLSVADIKVYGLEAKGCDYYEKKLAFNMSTASTLLQKLKESACLRGESKETQKETLKIQAKKFDEIIKKQTAVQMKQVKQVQKVITEIEAQQLKDRQLAAQAKRYGLEPPIPMYTKAQINELKSSLNPVERKLTEEEKAECMNINTRIQTLTQQASDMAAKMGDSSPIGPMEMIGNELKQLQDLYTTKCFTEQLDLSDFNIVIDESAPGLS